MIILIQIRVSRYNEKYQKTNQNFYINSKNIYKNCKTNLIRKMSKKYVMANINIPLQINIDDNNRVIPLTDYVKVSITKCDNLPEKSSDNFTIMEQINKLFSNDEPNIIDDVVLFSKIEDGTVNIVPDTDSSTDSGSESSDESDSDSTEESETNDQQEAAQEHRQESPLSISLNELLNKKPKSQHLNTSFKNKPTTSSRYTLKNLSYRIMIKLYFFQKGNSIFI